MVIYFGGRTKWIALSLIGGKEVQKVGRLYKRLLATVRTSKHQDNPLEKSTNIVSNHVVVASKLWNMFVLLDINNSSSYSFFVYQFGIILNPESSKLLDDIFDQLPTCGYGSPNCSTTN